MRGSRGAKSTEPPIQCELAIAEVLEDGVDKENQHLAAPAEWQQVSVKPIGEAIAEAPGTHQYGENIHQNSVPQRCQHEGPKIGVSNQWIVQHVLHYQEKGQTYIAQDFDQWSIIFEEPERWQST
jgi:hypothetical protein